MDKQNSDRKEWGNCFCLEFTPVNKKKNTSYLFLLQTLYYMNHKSYTVHGSY